MDLILFLIYVISLSSALVALWIWYSNDDYRYEVEQIKIQNQQLKIKIDQLEKLSKLNSSSHAFKTPFKN